MERLKLPMKRWFSLFVGMTAWLGSTAPLPATSGKLVVIAHRGEHQRHQENTLEAVQGAIDAGADFVEIDLRHSSDGKYLLMHDGTVDRMTDGHGAVKSLTWAELSKLQVHDRRLTNVPASRIPLFSEVLPLCKGRIHIYLDFKDADRAETAKMLREAGMTREVVVYDGAGAIAQWRKVAPELPVITSPPDHSDRDLTRFDAFLAEHQPEVLDQGDSAEMIAAAHRRGTKVWPDIQQRDENPDYWTRVLSRGMDGVQTDHPVELIAWLKATGRR
jgi:glycerophosphoryl diester phosphodiesterase